MRKKVYSFVLDAEVNSQHDDILHCFVIGFSADKLLKTVSDKVFSRLFAEAEKTKETK